MMIPPELVRALASAERVAALTGAGVSAESGVPTFRDAQTGLWARYSAEELATPGAFLRNPRLVWDWYAWRRGLVAAANPNDGHRALADLASLVPGFRLITQNVDGLHQRAGSRDVIELHGNITRIKCYQNGHPAERWGESGGESPKCAVCGSLLRPDVVWFEEPLPEAEIAEAQAIAAASTVFLSIGTSMQVYPAAALPRLALRAGAVVVEINPHPTALAAEAHHVFAAPSGEVLLQLVSALRSHLAGAGNPGWQPR